MSRWTGGRLLVASPQIGDPNFARTVVLMLQHDEDGALGLVLNRPSETHVDEVLPAWTRAVAGPRLVFVGGPVEQKAAICLGRRRRGTEPAAWRQSSGDLGTVDLDADPDEVAGDLEAVRLFAGYAGWGAGQLDAELDVGGWIVVDVEGDDAFTDEPEDLWRRVLARQPGPVRLVASFPEDPSLN